jgi:hypothetical protein
MTSNCCICKFNNNTPWDEPCNSCRDTEEKPRGTHWEFNRDDSEFVHPCRVCARSGDRAPVGCSFPEYKGIFENHACGHENQYYKFLPIEEPKEESSNVIPFPGKSIVEEIEEALEECPNELPEYTGDIGTAATSPHYNSLPIQPVELMEATLTREEFLGYLKGNMIKYAMRAGRKGETQKDVNKYNQYKEFYEYVIQPGHSISDLVK